MMKLEKQEQGLQMLDLDTVLQGLTDAEVARRQALYGKNVITEKAQKSFLQRVIEGFEDPMIRLLCGVATIMLLLTFTGRSEWYEPAGILVTVLIVTIVQAKQGMASDSEFRALKERTKPTPVKVIRNGGSLVMLDPSELVPGDIIQVESGDALPADCHIIKGSVQVSNAVLNGETEPIPKSANPTYRIPTRVVFLDEFERSIADITTNVEKAKYLVNLVTTVVNGKVTYKGRVYLANTFTDGAEIREDMVEQTIKSMGIQIDSNKASNIEVTVSVNVDTDEFGRQCASAKVESVSGISVSPDSLKVKAGVLQCKPVFDDEYTLHKGADVVKGSAYVMVDYTGMDTSFGDMAKDINSQAEIQTPLEVKLEALAGAISKFGYIGASTIFAIQIVMAIMNVGGIGQFIGLGWSSILTTVIDAVSTAVTVVVCAVPEGLPLMITIVLSQNSARMFKDNVLVLQQKGIETAGSLSLLASDKTGTITKGILEVVRFFTGGGVDIALTDINSHAKLSQFLARAISYNTTAKFDSSHHVVGGDITDKALLNYLTEGEFTKVISDKSNHRTQHQEFNSANKFSQSHVDSLGITFYTGAPERLLAKATKYMDADGSIHDIDMAVVEAKMVEYQKKALRVLAFGYSEKPMIEDTINDDVVIIGLVGIRDDVRPEAKDAIKAAQEAGIQVVMITGDNEQTAIAIARDAGLLAPDSVRLTPENKDALIEKNRNIKTSTKLEDGISVTSAMLNELKDDELKILLSAIRVISRALPTDKSRIVRICQEENLVVGMTGDGVNDSPALKRADVGFAMGSGTDAAKDSADIVITDDNFASIVKSILYGRTIYRNIQKFCVFQLSFNASLVMLNLLFPMIAPFNPALKGVTVLFGVVMMLVTNLLMDTGGGLMFGKEPSLASYMQEKPRKRDESIITPQMFGQVGVFTVYMVIAEFIWFLNPAISSLFSSILSYKTAFYASAMLAGMFGAWNARTNGYNLLFKIKENPDFVKFWIILTGVVIFMCAIGGPIGMIFNCAPFSLKGWLLVIITAIGIIPVDLARKFVVNNFMHK